METTTPESITPESEPTKDIEATTPKTDQENPSHGSKTWIIIVLVFLFLCATGVAGYFAYKNILLNQKEIPKKDDFMPEAKTSLTPTIKPSETPASPTPTIDPKAGWSIYTADNICYTFKYPSELELKVRTQEKIIHLSLWGPTQEVDTEFYDGISLSFSFPLDLGNSSLKDYVDAKVEESKQFGQILKPKEEITVNGVKGYIYTNEGLGVFQNIYLQSPDTSCTVEVVNATADPGSLGYQETVDQVLSTFKFNK